MAELHKTHVEGEFTISHPVGGGTTDIIDLIYPVGSIYISTSSANPQTLFGGSWSQLTGGYLYAGTSYTTGGSSTSGSTAITVAQMPSHTHTFTGSAVSSSNAGVHSHNIYGGCTQTPNYIGNATFEAYGWIPNLGGKTHYANYLMDSGSHTHSVTAQGSNSSAGGGSGHTHSINPPYISVYMWRRTA